MQEVLDVKPIDFKTLPRDGFIMLLGKRGSGKTEWARFYIANILDAHDGMFILMAGSNKVRDSWKDLIHPLYHHEPSIQKLQDIRDRQNQQIEYYKSNNQPFPSKLHITIVLDDCGSIGSFMRSDILRWIASNGRHCEMRIILMLQYLHQCPAELRNQIDIVFALATANKRCINVLHSEYAGCTSARVFRALLCAVTDNFGSLVIDNRINAMRIVDNCFYARMESWPIVVTGQLGHPEMIEFANTHFLREKEVLPIDDRMEVEEDEEEKEFMDIVGIVRQSTRYMDRQGQIVIRKVP